MNTVTALLGSPKSPDRSVTAALVRDIFAELSAAVPNLRTEVIALSERNVQMCRGCLACQKTGQCLIDDDVPAIREQLKRSDLLLFATPVHIGHVSGLYKNFLDRALVSLHTFECIGTPCINVITANGSGERETDKYVRKMALLLGAIPLGSVIKLKNDPFSAKAMHRVVRRAVDILTGKRKPTPTLMNRLYFWSMKGIILGNQPYFEYETRLWKARGWDKKDYAQALNEMRAAR